MGTHNLFHKKKERKTELLRRQRAMKEPYDVRKKQNQIILLN